MCTAQPRANSMRSKTQPMSIEMAVPLRKDETKLCQKVLGSLLCHDRIIDLTMLATVSDIAIESKLQQLPETK